MCSWGGCVVRVDQARHLSQNCLVQYQKRALKKESSSLRSQSWLKSMSQIVEVDFDSQSSSLGSLLTGLPSGCYDQAAFGAGFRAGEGIRVRERVGCCTWTTQEWQACFWLVLSLYFLGLSSRWLIVFINGKYIIRWGIFQRIKFIVASSFNSPSLLLSRALQPRFQYSRNPLLSASSLIISELIISGLPAALVWALDSENCSCEWAQRTWLSRFAFSSPTVSYLLNKFQEILRPIAVSKYQGLCLAFASTASRASESSKYLIFFRLSITFDDSSIIIFPQISPARLSRAALGPIRQVSQCLVTLLPEGKAQEWLCCDMIIKGEGSAVGNQRRAAGDMPSLIG